LSDLRVFEISIVDMPATGKKFFLYKRLVEPQLCGMSDVEVEKKLQKEWEQADEAERKKVLREVDRLDALLSLMILENNLLALAPPIRKQILADEGRGWDYNPETGAFTKSEKAKLTPLEGAESKSHYFNFETGKWHPKRERK
jgi:hypothetical protein